MPAASRTLETSHAASAVSRSATGMSRYSVRRPDASRWSNRLICVVPCRMAPDGAGVDHTSPWRRMTLDVGPSMT